MHLKLCFGVLCLIWAAANAKRKNNDVNLVQTLGERGFLPVENNEAEQESEDSSDGSGDEISSQQVTCGRPKNPPFTGSMKKIVDGKVAKPFSWPWQVSIIFDGEHECGGSILNKNYVLTAAHCFENERNIEGIKIIAGMHRMSSEDEGETRNMIPVQSIDTHPLFGKSNHDIAIIKLERPLRFSDEIQPICLPSIEEQLTVGTLCFVTGWGETRKNVPYGKENILSDYLRQASTRITNVNKCNKMYGNTLLTKTVLCATTKSGDACQGDSGGPLSCMSEKGHWFLAGITSFGDKCGGIAPGVYTNVQRYLKWIQNKVEMT